MSLKPSSPPTKSESKSPLPVPALYRDEGESEVESDHALDRPPPLTTDTNPWRSTWTQKESKTWQIEIRTLIRRPPPVHLFLE